MVTLKSCLNVLESERNTTFVKDVMHPKNKVKLLNIHDTAEKAYSLYTPGLPGTSRFVRPIHLTTKSSSASKSTELTVGVLPLVV